MELCTVRNNVNINSITESLKLLHSVKIIHGDVKNINILWSPTFSKFVLIDFGLSHCLK